MANNLIEAHDAARDARQRGADALDGATLATVRNHYLGALARGRDDNQDKRGTLATDARALIRRFQRYEDMILRFATDLAVPFTNNEAEKSCPSGQGPATHLRRCSANTRGPDRLRDRSVRPGHRHQMGTRQTQRPP